MEWNYQDLQKWITEGCDSEIGSKVVKLDINYNKLKEIPKEIGQLVNLQEFDCSRNQILKIPKEIWQLINLKKIDCFGNKISKIPRRNNFS